MTRNWLLHYEVNGREGTVALNAVTWAEALESFAEWWENTGGELPAPTPW